MFKGLIIFKCLQKDARYMSSIIPNRLQGKVAVVTASATGIGFAIAKRLALEGAKVLISDRRQQKVNEAVKKLEQSGMNIIGTVCHVGKSIHRIRMLRMASCGLGGIDILVSVVGINPEMQEVLDSSERAWGKVFDINVKCGYTLAKETVPYMQQRGKGKIIFLTSIAAYQPLQSLGAYSVSKTALLGLTKAAALQLAKDNINVNAVAPGIIETSFSEVIRTGEIGKQKLASIPMGRFGTPDDVSGVVAYLASEDSDYITGEVICVTGGMMSRL